jgi:CMP-N-acetylneuraminic acid synthetase
MKLTALMPMKGHSERVPGKNIRDFAGKPLCLHVIDMLLECPGVEEVLINTDSERIAELVSTGSRVRIVERPKELRGDFVPMNAIIEHDLGFVKTDHVLQTHATNPLLTSGTLAGGIKTYFQNLGAYDSLFSVTAWHTRFYRQDGRAVNHNPAELLRTQDLPPLYEENSCFYLFSPTSFRANNNTRIGKKPLLYPIPRLEAIDIDEEDDFLMAQALMLARQK